jgi:hypothetical protein
MNLRHGRGCAQWDHLGGRGVFHPCIAFRQSLTGFRGFRCNKGTGRYGSSFQAGIFSTHSGVSIPYGRTDSSRFRLLKGLTGGYGSCSFAISKSRDRADLLSVWRSLHSDGASAAVTNHSGRGGIRV